MPEKSIVHSREFMDRDASKIYKYYLRPPWSAAEWDKTVVLEVIDRKIWNKFAGYFVNRFKDYSRYRGGQGKLMSAMSHIKKTIASPGIQGESFKFNFLKKLLNAHLTLLKTEGFKKE